MRWKRFTVSILILVILLSSVSNAGIVPEKTALNSVGQGIVQLSSQEGQPKVVSVIFDNSSSMVKKDDGDKRYTTRWIEADYTVKALAAMMDNGDILRLYVMSNYRDDKKSRVSHPGEIVIKNSKKETIQEVSNYLNNMQFSELTYYQGVEKAAEHMTPYLDSGKDCWIVILTDGVFIKPEKLDAEHLKNKLKGITKEGKYGKGRIRIAYIPIGDGAPPIEEDLADGIYVSDVPDGADAGQEGIILKKVTDAINRIYGRVRLETNIEERYLSRKDGQIIFDFDIPLEKLIVFMQQSGPEELYVNTKGKESSNDKMVTDSPRISAPLKVMEEAEFEGRRDLPSFEDGAPSYNPDLAMYKELRGVMFTYVRDAKAQSGYQNQQLIIPVNNEDKAQPDVEVYYQPAVKVNLEYVQDGEPIEHTEECLKTMNQADHEEYCIREGGLTVKLGLMDYNGNLLNNTNSGLLYKNKFKLSLYSQEDGTEQDMEPAGNDYEYRADVQQKDYRIIVTTPWDVQETGILKVQEKRKNLEISLVDTDTVWLNQSEEGASLIKVRVNEDGMIPPRDIMEQMTVTCTCGDERLEMEALERNDAEPGIWTFRPHLREANDNHIAEDAVFSVTASRPYAVGDPSAAGMEFRLPLAANPEELLVMPETDKAVNVSSLLAGVTSYRVPLTYVCAYTLDKDQKKEVVKSDLKVEPESLAPYISIGDDGDIYIKKGLRWFGAREKTAAVTFQASYNLWNTQNDAEVSIPLEFNVIPLWVQRLIEGVIIAILIWIAACLIKRQTHSYIHKFKAELCSDTVRKIYRFRLRRLRHIILPFYKNAYLIYEKAKRVDKPIMPSVKLVIRNNKYGRGYEIVNYKDFMDSDKYQIDGMAITEENHIFSSENEFSLVDERGDIFIMRIETR